MDEKPATKPMGQVIQVKDHLGEIVRETVEEALNAMLDAETDQQAVPDATSAARRGRTRAPAAMNDRWKREPVRSA